MICKNCGNSVEPQAGVCPRCGKAIRLEGGIGFWDMAAVPKPAAPVTPPETPEPERADDIKAAPLSKLPILIGAALCVLGLLLFAVGKISSARELKALTNSYEEQLRTLRSGYEEQLRQTEADYTDRLGDAEGRLTAAEEELSRTAADYEARLGDMQGRLAAAEEELGRAEPPKPEVEVVHRPTGEERPVGYDQILFIFGIRGEALSFTWEKRDENGEWQALQFNEDGIDERYGLMLVENLQEGESRLRAVGLTESSAGDYRCTAVTENGSASAEASLRLLP